MNDDWRLRVTLTEPDHAGRLAGALAATDLEKELVATLHDRVIVSRDGAEVFIYSGTREQADRAQLQLRSLAGEHGWEPEYELKRWHPASEEWEDPDEPLPASDSDRAAEHAELIERERAESQTQGYPDYEVRIECPSHRETAELADRLRQEGIPSVQRWKFLLVGALDEDGANALAERLRQEAPAGSKVTVEGTIDAALEGAPVSPYAVFGGLGG